MRHRSRQASWLEHEEETISISYTSGTTGRPKGVLYTYRGAYLNALGVVIDFGLSAESVHLWVLPLFHCNGWCFPWALASVRRRERMPSAQRTRAQSWEAERREASLTTAALRRYS